MKVIKIDESLIDYFLNVLGADNSPTDFKTMLINQFKTKVEESLGCGNDVEKKVFWVKCKGA